MPKVTQQLKEQKMQRMADLLAPVRLDEGEKHTLKTVFGEDMAVYKVLRDLFFGFPLTEEEHRIVENFKGIKDLLRKIFIPSLQKHIPIGQNYDLWQTQDIKTASEDNFDTVFDAKTKLLNLLEKGFKRMEDIHDNQIILAVEKDLASIVARNNYINYVDSQIRFLMQFVNLEDLSDAEKLKIMQLNSSK